MAASAGRLWAPETPQGALVDSSRVATPSRHLAACGWPPTLFRADPLSCRACSGRTPVSEDLCLYLVLPAGVTLKSVAPASRGPGRSSTKEEEDCGWEG